MIEITIASICKNKKITRENKTELEAKVNALKIEFES